MLSKKVLLISVALIIFLGMAAIHAEDSTDLNSTQSVKSYTNLTDQIDEVEDGGTLNLTEGYQYDKNVDKSLSDGVKITKSMTVKGSGNSYIDGAGTARCLYIGSHCNVILENLIIKNGYSKTHGAGIYLDEYSNLTLINCILQNNVVYNSDGGAINAQPYTNLIVQNSRFESNDAIRESTLEWEDFKAGMGGAICIRIGSNMVLNSSVFTGNQAYLAMILVISYDDVKYKLSTMSVRGCTFEKNNVKRCGIIYEDERGSGEIVDCTFKNNVLSETGTVLDLDACVNTVVRNCVFEGNSAKSGGAIRLKIFKSKYISHVSIIGCTFTKNTANNGGAIYCEQGDVYIENCKFTQNHAEKKGGAIYSFLGNTNIKGCTFTSNSAANGGALYMDEEAVIVDSSTFSKNAASSKGGAIITEAGSFKITNSKFNQNSAANGGGAYLNSKSSSIASSSFSKNSASGKGGAIYCTLEDVKNTGITYSKNSAGTAAKVYGAFKAKVKAYTFTKKRSKVKVILSSPWKMSVSQKIQITVKGAKTFTSSWVKTDANGKIKIVVPFKINVNKYTVSVSMKQGVCYVKSFTKVKDKAIITAPKKVKKPAKIKLTIKNKGSKTLIKNTKFTVKVYTGKKYKQYTKSTNSKGILKIKTANLTLAKHKIIVLLSNKNYNINNKLKVKVK